MRSATTGQSQLSAILPAALAMSFVVTSCTIPKFKNQPSTMRGSRARYLDWIAKTRREVDDLRATIDAVPREVDLPPDYQRMIAWAEWRLANLEAQTTVEQIQATLVERGLYADPDPLYDPEGDPLPEVNYWDY